VITTSNEEVEMVAGDSNNPGARSVPLLKLVISKGPMPVQVCDYHKQQGSGNGFG
jgi:hypothetical protein